MPLPSLYSSLSSFFLKQYRIKLNFGCLKFFFPSFVPRNLTATW